jgi:hypothetical protein
MEDLLSIRGNATAATGDAAREETNRHEGAIRPIRQRN